MNHLLKTQIDNKSNLVILKDYFTKLISNQCFEEAIQIKDIIKTMEQLNLELENITRYERGIKRSNRISKIFNT